MEYNKLISVAGMPGLYELLSSKTDGVIVRSLDDQTTKFVSSRMRNVSHLETIEVYTNHDNVNLADVFKVMQENSEPLPSEKDAAAVKAYFEKVYPEIDFDRVYVSDMKKMLKWFSVLQKNNVEIKTRSVDETETEEAETDPVQTSDEA